MDKDKLITLLTSDDKEIREVGLEIIKNNFDCDFTIYGGVKRYDGKLIYSLQKEEINPITIIEKTAYTELKRTVERINYFRIYLAKNIIELIIEYNNEYRQNKRINTI